MSSSKSEDRSKPETSESGYQFGIGVLERRAINYIIDELDAGRHLFDILKDPYIKNRIDPIKMQQLLADPELLEAFREEIEKAREGLQ
ncbi:MAG: hypothetical protein FWC54_01600 [Actinomycetia bacterium]|nr:hypothetical protein [Actinomycetes bacterium]